MSVGAPPIPPSLPPRPQRTFTPAEYQQMIQSGTLSADDNVELLEGLIIPKMPHNPLHDGTVQLANATLRHHLPKEWDIRIQSAMTTADSQPEPDLAIVRGHARAYLKRHPTARDIGMGIEVADTSVVRDQELKARIYARAGVPVYWIVNLADDRIEVYTDPTGAEANPTYRQRRDFHRGDDLPLVLDGQEVARIPAADLLP